MSRLDDFTLSLLTNSEVIDVNQDPLGKPGMPVTEKGMSVVYAKPLEDGSVAVGLFNRGEVEEEITATWRELGLRGEQTVRDIWKQEDICVSDEAFSVKIRPHGVCLIKIYPGNSWKRAISER